MKFCVCAFLALAIFPLLRGSSFGGDVQACVCMNIEFKTCGAEFGGWPGNGAPLTCAGNCTSVPLGSSPTEVIWSCNTIGQSTFTILSLVEWGTDPHKKGVPIVGEGIGLMGESFPPHICYIEEECYGCDWSVAAQSMVCKVSPVIHSIPLAFECLDANFNEIVCFGDPG